MTVVFVVVAAVVAVGILEGGSWVLALLMAKVIGKRVPDRAAFYKEQSERLGKLAANQSVRAKIHPVLGWEYGTGTVSDTEHLNNQGLRAEREYAVEPPPGITRIAAFGDSYVYCNEVGDAESWPAQLETGYQCEVLNYGVGGYGTDQALLRFREEGRRMKPRVVIIGFTSMMATRVVSRYRRFQDPGDGPWFKPRFVLDGAGLKLLASPVGSRSDAERILANPGVIAEFGREDYWYNPAVFEHRLYPISATYRLLAWAGHSMWLRYFHRDRMFKGQILNEESESFNLLSRIFVEFASDVRAAGMDPVVLMLPARGDVNLFVDRKAASYETLRAHLEQLGMRVIDPVHALTSSSIAVDDLFYSAGHYSPKGNAIVAGVIAEALRLPRRAEQPVPRHEASV